MLFLFRTVKVDEFIGGLERTDEATIPVERNTGRVIGITIPSLEKKYAILLLFI